MPISFTLQHRAGTARVGRLDTPHGAIETPVFMPVGTHATVQGLTPRMLRDLDARIILGHTHHLARRPGDEPTAALRRRRPR